MDFAEYNIRRMWAPYNGQDLEAFLKRRKQGEKDGRYETGIEFQTRLQMERREEERGRREFRERKRAQTLGERPYGDYHHTHPHPDAPPTTLSSSRPFAQHNDTSSSTDSRGNQEFGQTYNDSRSHYTRLSDRDTIGGNAVTHGYSTLRTRNRRSATVPNDRTSSAWRPHHLNSLGAINEGSDWQFQFDGVEDNNSPGDDDDNRTYVDPHDAYIPNDPYYPEESTTLPTSETTTNKKKTD